MVIGNKINWNAKISLILSVEKNEQHMNHESIGQKHLINYSREHK